MTKPLAIRAVRFWLCFPKCFCSWPAVGAPAVPSPSPSSPQVLGFQVRFPDEREHTLAGSPRRSRNSFCLGTDNEVSVGALNHLMLKGIPRRLHQSLCKIVRDLHQLINLIWGLFCWHLHKPSENYSYCIPIQYLNSELQCPFPSPPGGQINLCHRI